MRKIHARQLIDIILANGCRDYDREQKSGSFYRDWRETVTGGSFLKLEEAQRKRTDGRSD
jgi:hypothetical protein